MPWGSEALQHLLYQMLPAPRVIEDLQQVPAGVQFERINVASDVSYPRNLPQRQRRTVDVGHCERWGIR